VAEHLHRALLDGLREGSGMRHIHTTRVVLFVAALTVLAAALFAWLR
jgi:hypothetical protein